MDALAELLRTWLNHQREPDSDEGSLPIFIQDGLVNGKATCLAVNPLLALAVSFEKLFYSVQGVWSVVVNRTAEWYVLDVHETKLQCLAERVKHSNQIDHHVCTSCDVWIMDEEESEVSFRETTSEHTYNSVNVHFSTAREFAHLSQHRSSQKSSAQPLDEIWHASCYLSDIDFVDDFVTRTLRQKHGVDGVYIHGEVLVTHVFFHALKDIIRYVAVCHLFLGLST